MAQKKKKQVQRRLAAKKESKKEEPAKKEESDGDTPSEPVEKEPKLRKEDIFKIIPDSEKVVVKDTICVKLVILFSCVVWLYVLVWSWCVNFFGVVLIASLLLALWLSLGEKQPGEVSAYSVFNKNQRRLLGQLTAEHFERDIINRNI